ncbi:polysaccharide biosynthesis tyrosine autokinase [Myxosarcina sp. GI1]|uniref:GumC family protein n=1 Tax=Myxosarcina sp. GI1 TaxID=1541065 RepID=UPI00055AE670|nr:polysaccharide biosynthesis tyrosine autokinase [Myxosarcina sp. GI1]
MNNNIIRPDIIDFSNINSQETSFSLVDLKQIVYRRWKPALAVGIVAFTGFFLSTILKTPQYRSETLILLETPQNQQAASVAPTETPASKFYSIKDLSTEIFVLRSNSMVAGAIDNLKDRYPNISVSQVVGNLSIYQAATNEIPTDVLVVSYTDADPEKAKAVLEALGSTYVNYSLEKQRSQATKGIEFINSQLPKAQEELDDAAKALRQFRQVNQINDPEASATLATGTKLTIEEQIRGTEIAIDLKQKQVKVLEKQLAELGQDSEIMVAASVLGQDGVYTNLATELKEIETQYNLGKVNFRDSYYVMEDLKERQKELKKLLKERARQVLGNSVSPAIVDRVVLAQGNNNTALTPQTDASATADNTASSSQSDSGTTAKNAQEDINSEGSILLSFANQKLRLETEIATLQSELAGLKQSKLQAENTFQSIPQLQQTYTELQRQLGLKSEAYNYLLGRRQELEIAEAGETAPWRILNAPFLPSKPVSPDIKQGLFMSLAAGVFLGIATAFILQQLDQRVKQVEEVKQLTKLPVLGIIPRVDEPQIDINIHTTRRSYSYYSSFTEGLRSLAMNLRYLMIETGRIKTLAITSSTSAEGKSTITHNLGLVLAEFGLRVLIVDADMRKPKIHKLAQLPNQSGLSDAITQEEDWTNYVQTGTVENLSIITSGETSPNPIALLNSDKMKQLINQWQQAYDYVLLDTPPIGVIADAKSIASQIDSFLFIAGIQRVNRKAIGNSLEILRSSQCNIAGVVANMVDPEFDYYAYSYYDSYYNQSASNADGNEDRQESESRISNIMQQFRRR